MDEEWRTVPGHPGYLVSDHGRVRSLDRVVQCRNGKSQRIRGVTLTPYLSGGKGKKKYQCVKLTGGSKHRVHQLVALAFIGPRPGELFVCHKDDDQFNNHVSNLRYDTHKANVDDSLRNGSFNHRRRLVCPSGHEIKGANLDRATFERRGWRTCLACYRAGSYCSSQKCPERLDEMKQHYYEQALMADRAEAA